MTDQIQNHLQISPINEDSLIIRFEDPAISRQKIKILHQLKNSIFEQGRKYIIDIVPSYSSLMINYEILLTDYDDLTDMIHLIMNEMNLQELKYYAEDSGDAIQHQIPVCYEDDCSLDRELLETRTKLTWEDVVELHTNKVYDVFAVGFTPGFAYMGEVNEQLCSPRLKTPRLKIPTGSVGIADLQTGIYPFESPGGWNIIGRTPLNTFSINRSKKNESIDGFQVGDQIQFFSINKNEFTKYQGLSLNEWKKIHG